MAGNLTTTGTPGAMALSSLKGNPMTFRGGTFTVQPLTSFGAQVANAPIINCVIKSGSSDADATEAEADTNIFGRLVTAGNPKTSVEMSLYVSQDNLTAPFQNGTAWPMEQGDYLTGNITCGSTNVSGVFMISKQAQTYDANENLNLDITLTSHGFLTNNKHKILAG